MCRLCGWNLRTSSLVIAVAYTVFEELFSNRQIIQGDEAVWEPSGHSGNSTLKSPAKRNPGHFKTVPNTIFLNYVKSMFKSEEPGRFERFGL